MEPAVAISKVKTLSDVEGLRVSRQITLPSWVMQLCVGLSFALRRHSLIQKTEFGIRSMTRQKGVQQLLPYELMMNTLRYLKIVQMKLEKKSTSMEKNLNNHKAAQIKAQEMRRNMSESVV
ncbi:hypothetical protein Tco_0942853, partial [Tanacetum coccineum]